MTDLLCIDPGTTESAYVLLQGGLPTSWATPSNEIILGLIKELKTDVLIEEITSYGQPVGQETFSTVRFCGRFEQQALSLGLQVHYLPRHEVKMRLCHATKGVNDAVLRQRVIDLYGGKEKAIGTKKKMGPCYGMRADEWQALALGLAWIGAGA